MTLPLPLDRDLDSLDPPAWDPPPPNTTRLVETVHALRRTPLRALTPADLRTLITQEVGLPYVLPVAVALLLEEPLLDAYFYEGDLLRAALACPSAAWSDFPDLARALAAVAEAIPADSVAELPRGAAAEIARFVAGPGRA
ncbi:contact-dependent growth inhibition system immunity protein [Streptomyces sp. NPDC087917]|uniref:contact-dependent growth inhibition system immunity protein n=1 Tax=Streptomyces sp. NPDC087917 TaxID=3155060 RepID=UPI00343E9591